MTEIINKLTRGDIAAIVIGVTALLLISIIIGAVSVYGIMKMYPSEPVVIEKNNTIIVEKNITTIVIPNITQETTTTTTEPGIQIYLNGSIDIPTTTTTTSTLPGFTVDGNGKLLPEDAERLMQLAMDRLREQQSTTTTTLKTKLSTAPMYGLYNPFEAANFDGQFLINRSIKVTLKTVDGSGVWNTMDSYRIDPVTPAEARYFSNNIGDSDVVQVLYKMKNGTTIDVGRIQWNYDGS